MKMCMKQSILIIHNVDPISRTKPIKKEFNKTSCKNINKRILFE